METNNFTHAIDLEKIAVSGHCPLAKMAKEYREKAEKIDREGRGIRY